MKITEYPSVTELDDDNVFLLDGPNGTKKIAKSDLVYALFDSIPEMHKKIYRGKNLGSSYTAEQKNAVNDGTFHDLWVGDYWQINGHEYYIADFDYYYDPLNNAHELVIISNDEISNIKWDDKDLESYSSPWRSYTESTLYKYTLPDYAANHIPTTFKNSLISNSVRLNNSINHSPGWTFGDTGSSFYEISVNFPTFEQIFGYDAPAKIYPRPDQAETNPTNSTDCGCYKFSIFDFIGLREMKLTNDYATISHNGGNYIVVYGQSVPVSSAEHTRNSFQSFYLGIKDSTPMSAFAYFTIRG